MFVIYKTKIIYIDANKANKEFFDAMLFKI